MKLVYSPSDDELVLEMKTSEEPPNIAVGPYKLWWDSDGNILEIAIKKYTKELKEFNRNVNIIQLAGIWKDVKITDEDIKGARGTLLRKIEEKW